MSLIFNYFIECTFVAQPLVQYMKQETGDNCVFTLLG